MESRLLDGLNEEEKSAFLALFENKKIAKGETIKKEGQKRTDAFFVTAGSVEVRRSSTDEEMAVAQMEGGEDVLFSADSLIDGGVSLTTVIATKESEAIFIERRKFENFCRQNPETGTKLLLNLTKMLTQFLRKGDEKIAEMYKTLEEVL